jgi:hypothetical protein
MSLEIVYRSNSDRFIIEREESNCVHSFRIIGIPSYLRHRRENCDAIKGNIAKNCAAEGSIDPDSNGPEVSIRVFNLSKGGLEDCE